MANQSEVKAMFAEIGFNKVEVTTSYKNGYSNYATLCVNVIDEKKCWAGMFIDEGIAYLTIRISDHPSGLEMHSGGVSGNRMTFDAFKKLVVTGAIAS